jgi:hypothetical protein
VDIWKIGDGSRFVQSLDCKPYRLVEDQYKNSTLKLVGSIAEQEILETLLERSKPPAPIANSRGKLSYLLYTKFRYPPLRYGSRFGKHIEQSIFSSSLELKTALAEQAYLQLLHNNATKAELMAADSSFTHFQVHVKTERAIRLEQKPFDKFKEQISHPLSYDASQALGTTMRQAGIEAFSFYSARISEGINVGLLSIEAFAKNEEFGKQNWLAHLGKDKVIFRSLSTSEEFAFTVEDFAVDGKFPFIQ